MKKLLTLLFLLNISGVLLSQCGCTKIVFIIDNSGSITSTYFSQMKPSVDSISTQLLRNYPGAEISIIQYASQSAANHAYHVTVPFTSNPVTARTWNRAYGATGTVNSTYFQDHLPGSLQSMRSDSIWYAGKSADIVTGACNVRMFLFTDASYGSTTLCCSHLINNSLATLAMANFGEYNWHKSNFSSEWTVYHVTFGTNTTAMQAGAAIASKGGSYTGTIAANPGDPQGSGGPRKYYPFTTFNLTQPQIDTALANINAGAFSASFPNDTICLGDSANFASNIIFPTSKIIWDFGDGNYDSSSTAPTHFYAAAGTYQVTLIAWSADSSCKDTVTNPVVIHPPLVPDFLADTACLGSPTTFTNTTSGYIDKLVWDFGDGSSSTFNPDTTHTYAAPGTYSVKLFVNSSDICFDSIVKNIVINDVPVADFRVTNQCQFLDVFPQNTTTVITAKMASIDWSWDFGNSTFSSQKSPTTSYLLPGTYNIQLIAETPEGCADTIVRPIVIDPKPVASFMADTACLTHPTTFTDQSTVLTGNVTNWSWDFPGTPTTQNTTHIFPSEGVFPVTLTVTTDSVCSDDTTMNIVVRSLPFPDFDFTPQKIVIFDTKVCFTNTSAGGVAYLWDFDFAGSNGSSILAAPCTVKFPNEDEGVYDVKLTAFNQFGCFDSIIKELIVLDAFTIYVPNTFTPNDDTKNETFKVHIGGIVDYELFIFSRWGEEIFHSTDSDDEWDGKYKGEEVPTGAYAYRVVVKTKYNEIKEYLGEVNVLR